MFRDEVTSWANQEAFESVLADIANIDDPDKRVKAKMALLAWAMPKISPVDFEREKPRDIRIEFVGCNIESNEV